MTTRKINPIIARLDRSAAGLGLPLRERTPNTREFSGFGRQFVYRPGGLGIVKVHAYVGANLDTIAFRTTTQMEALFERAIAYNEENNR